MNFVTSVDGAVTVAGYSEGLSSTADKRVFSALRGLCDALLVGAGTLRHENYRPVRLDEARRARRLAAGLPDTPTLVVVSGRLELDPGHPALSEAPVRPIVLTHSGSPMDKRAALNEVADVLIAGEDQVDLTAGLSLLSERGLTQLLCEGGPNLFGALYAENLVDEVCLTVTPMLAGPVAGRIIAGPHPVEAIRTMVLSQLIEEDGTLMLRYSRA
jgi:riboflavin biosynthesis pyrimidine reductase